MIVAKLTSPVFILFDERYLLRELINDSSWYLFQANKNESRREFKIKRNLTAQILNSSNEKLIKFLAFRPSNSCILHSWKNTNKKEKSTSQSKTIKQNDDQVAQTKSNPHKSLQWNATSHTVVNHYSDVLMRAKHNLHVFPHSLLR